MDNVSKQSNITLWCVVVLCMLMHTIVKASTVLRENGLFLRHDPAEGPGNHSIQRRRQPANLHVIPAADHHHQHKAQHARLARPAAGATALSHTHSHTHTHTHTHTQQLELFTTSSSYPKAFESLVTARTFFKANPPTHTYSLMCKRAHAHTHTHTRTSTHSHTHTHAYTHTHTATNKCRKTNTHINQ